MEWSRGINSKPISICTCPPVQVIPPVPGYEETNTSQLRRVFGVISHPRACNPESSAVHLL